MLVYEIIKEKMGCIPMPKIENKEYRNFLDSGIIEPISETEIKQALDNVSGRHKTAARAVILALYYTGGRPVQILNIKGQDVKRKDSYVTIRLAPAKNGLPTTVYLPYRNKYVRELYAYAAACMPQMYIFHQFRTTHRRQYKTKKGIQFNTSITDGLRYRFSKWFAGVRDITPYFLRHNRFSKLAMAGATDRQIQQLKGAKSADSVKPYIHLSSDSAKKVAKLIK
jgi:integrase